MEPTTTTTGSGKTAEVAPPPPPAVASGAAREEDSGLHDIRSLAQSTKQRLSRKITAAPPVDDDVLASSSAGWKAVALPEPARMISLPALDQLPSKKQIKEQIKAAKAAPTPAPASTPKAEVVRAPTHLDDSAPVAKAAPAASMSFGANITAKKSGGSKTPLYAVMGLGLAAAAGGLIYVATRGKTETPPPAVAKLDTAPVALPTTPPPPVIVPAAPPAEIAATGSAAVVTPPVDVPVTAPIETKAPGKHAKGSPAKPESKKVVDTGVVAKPEVGKKVESPKGGKEPPKEGEPDFNDLLKEAGVKDPTKAKPKLEKKSLSGGDFKAGMGGIAGKAQACYAGTQGTATVKLTVGPDGKVTKASVSGPFAGTAVASCVENAVRGASFPAWDGGPQSFGYSFLLSE